MCLDFEVISAYCDNELPDGIKKDVQSHLAICDSCRNTLKTIQNVTHNIYLLDIPEISSDFADKIIATLPTTLPCSTYEILSAYCDKVLDFEKFKEIKHHLTECNVCEKKIKNISALSNAVKNLAPVYKPNDFFVSKLLAAISQKEQKIIDFNLWQVPRIRRFAIAAGIALVGILVFTNTYDNQFDNIENVDITITAEDFLFSSPSNDSLNMTKNLPEIPLLEDNSS